MSRQETIDRIMQDLTEDTEVRTAVIRRLAGDFPQDFLAPVKINSQALGTVIGDGPGDMSNKEWQE